MRQTKLNSEQKTLDEILAVYEKQDKGYDDVSTTQEYPIGDINELVERNRVLLEALRKVKLLVERLLGQNRELKRKVEVLEDESSEQENNRVKVVSTARYNEMQNNANELARSMPKLIKLIKLLNQENKLVKEKYSALEDEFEDLINEKDDLKQKLSRLNETNQEEVFRELAQLFPSEEIAEKIAKSISSQVDQEKTTPSISDVINFEQQAWMDLNQVGGFSTEQISKLVDLVVEINEKIENLSGSMIVAPPPKRKTQTQLDLTGAIAVLPEIKEDSPPDRPDLEEVLDDILVSG